MDPEVVAPVRHADMGRSLAERIGRIPKGVGQRLASIVNESRSR
ncbi:MAG: hypothetical protein ACP5KY_03615 [Thermoproteus sp.]